jgi:hypothetical protein
MADSKAKPRYNAGRRIAGWPAPSLPAIAAYSVGGTGWRARWRRRLRRASQAEPSRGNRHRLRGPERFRLPVPSGGFRCKRSVWSRPVDRVTIQGPADSEAPRRSTNRRASSPNSTALFQSMAGTASNLELGWRLGRASAVIGQPLPQRASVSVDEDRQRPEHRGRLLRAGHAEAHMRRNEGALDLAVRYDGLARAKSLTRAASFRCLPAMPT